MKDRQNPELDALLDDIRQLLDDDQPLTKGDARYYEDLGRGEPRAKTWAETQHLPRHVAKLQRNQEQAYYSWLEQQGVQPVYEPMPEEPAPKKKKKKKKRHILRKLVLTAFLLAVAAVLLVVLVLPKQPLARQDTLGPRKDGSVTILVAGTDKGGTRTDTLVLLSLHPSEDRASLVSIPRDTLIHGDYSVPKINSVYDGTESGMDLLLTKVSQCIGFRPDGYVVVDLSLLEDFVDILGGVEFDVPMDMKAGYQTLSGEQAMELLRFRSGYADADLGRVRVQRDFLTALMKKTVSMEGLLKSPQLLQLLQQAQTDLSAENLLWLARTALQMDLSQVETATLPGESMWILGGSYYVLDRALTAQTVNAYCNPYVQAVAAENLQIRIG